MVTLKLEPFLIGFAVILVVYFIITTFRLYDEVSFVKSDIDNRQYIIRRGKSKSLGYLKDSANMLAEINLRITKLIEHFDKNFSNDESKRYFISKLNENYGPHILSEAALDQRYTTFTVDKKDMHICLRTRDTAEKIYDINTLMYVILHELAHLCNFDKNGNAIQGHGHEFKMIFKFFVVEAIKINVYEYVDYSVNPHSYCGIFINSTIVSPNQLSQELHTQNY